MTDKERLNYIDSLRGVAIIMVIMVHTSQSITDLYPTSLGQLVNFGQMGVQLFFVLSALSLCFSMDRILRSNENLFVFYIKRFFRIAPLYYVGIIVYYLLSFFKNFVGKKHALVPGDQYTIDNVLANVFFVHGFVPNANNNIVPGGWSIGTEMAFYVIFPFVFILYNNKNFLLSITYMLISIVICYTCVYRLEGSWEKWFLYFNLINMFPVFILGIFYFRYIKNYDVNYLISSKYLSVFLTILFLVFSYLSFTFNHNIIVTPFLAGLSFIFLIDVFKYFDKINNRFLIKVGQLSYSVYLFHFLIAHQFSKGIDLVLSKRLNPFIVYFICLVITIFFSYWIASKSEKIIEKPGIKLGHFLIEYFKLSNKKNVKENIPTG